MANLRVYVPFLDLNGSSYYRINTPLETMQRMGLEIEVFKEKEKKGMDLGAFYRADIGLFYQPIGERILEEVKRAKLWSPVQELDGSWKWGPSFVVDTDDDLLHVHPMNPTFRTLGIRMPDGSVLPDSTPTERTTVGGVDEQGNRQELYVDGRDGFNLAANKKSLFCFRDWLETADAVTVSTPKVADYIRRDSTQRNIFESPNMVRFDHYEKVDLRPHPEQIRILWQGSPTHFEDFDEIKDVLASVIKRYPETHFILWGQMTPWVLENIPSNQFTYIPWCSYAEYRLRLATIGHDISLGPLTPHKFNQCRSAIKFYESVVLHTPSAFLGQSGGPYEREVIDGQTGMIWHSAKEFGEKLCTLIENAKLRKELAENGKQWVKENRDAYKLAPKLYEFWQSLRAQKRDSQPIPNLVNWERDKKALYAKIDKQIKMLAERGQSAEVENAAVHT